MKNFILVALVILNSSLAFSGEPQVIDLINFEKKINALVSEKMDVFESPLVENKHKKIHLFTNNFTHQLINQLQKDIPLNGHQLAIANISLSAYLQVSKELNEELVQIEPSQPTFDGSDKSLRWMILSSQLIQDYKQTYNLFHKNKALRKVVKDQARINNSGVGSFLKITKSILNKKKVLKLRAVVKSFQQSNKLDDDNKLVSALSSGVIFNKVSQDKSLKEFYKIKSFKISVGDTISNITTRLTSGLSAGFGALVGPVKWRRGRLNKNKKAYNQLLKKLRPLDLILEKKSFKLTDYTIPGHWGHIGVWLGNEKQLKEIGMWNHPVIKPFQKKIKDGYSIYEVRRWGLVWDKLENWLNLDKMAIVRHEQSLDYTKEEYTRIYRELFTHIGKKYDYSFDTMTANTITCTEIISLSYGPVNWPTSKVVGRHTLQPDNIASLTLYKDTPVKFVTLLTGDKRGNHKFESKEAFAKLIGFRPMKSDSNRFEKGFKKCKRVRSRRTARGGVRFKNECHIEYKNYTYEKVFNHLDNNEL